MQFVCRGVRVGRRPNCPTLNYEDIKFEEGEFECKLLKRFECDHHLMVLCVRMVSLPSPMFVLT